MSGGSSNSFGEICFVFSMLSLGAWAFAGAMRFQLYLLMFAFYGMVLMGLAGTLFFITRLTPDAIFTPSFWLCGVFFTAGWPAAFFSWRSRFGKTGKETPRSRG